MFGYSVRSLSGGTGRSGVRSVVLGVVALMAAGLITLAEPVTTPVATAAVTQVRPGTAVTVAATARSLPAPGPLFGAVFHGMWGDISFRDRDRLLAKLSRTGVRWVRVGVPWALIQPRRPTASDRGYSMKWGVPRLDRIVRMAQRYHLKVSITLLRTPGWANGHASPEVLPTRLGRYAHVARWLAHRYAGRVQSYEVWNEPNHPGQLHATVGHYTRLLCRAYSALHRGDPRTKVVFGGTSGNDWLYLRQAYRAGAKNCFDVMATHPYSRDISPLTKPLNQKRWWFRNAWLVRRTMVRWGDRDKRLWFTEVGWSTHANSRGMSSSKRGVTRAQQARFALQMLRYTRRHYPYVKRVCWYSARNERTGDLENDHFGMFTLGLKPKPVVPALRAYLHP